MNRLPIIWPSPGAYVLAVSGGADSMVLLDVMAKAASQHRYKLYIGHVDHGLRADSAADRQFVEAAAHALSLPFSYTEANLPAGASEATARVARHAWLANERERVGATALITGHHQDDLLETSLLNLARGSHRRGLAPMQDQRVLRPLLDCTRAQLRQYAREHQVTWQEDPTNADPANPRNLLRHYLLTAAPAQWRDRYLGGLAELAGLNRQIDTHLRGLLTPHVTDSGYAWPRQLIHQLSLVEVTALLAEAIRQLSPSTEIHARLLDELALFARTATAGRRSVSAGLWLVCIQETVGLVVQDKAE